MNPWSLRCSKLALATVDIHGAVLDCDLWTRRGINFCYCTSHNFIGLQAPVVSTCTSDGSDLEKANRIQATYPAVIQSYWITTGERGTERMTQCIGYWKSQKADENFEAYLKEIGIGFAQRQLGKLVTSYEEITQDGDTWTISIQASVKHGSVSFKLGEEVDETTPDGRKVRSRFEIEDDKLVKYQTSSDGKHSVKMTRERLDENTLVMTFETAKTKARRTYIKAEKGS